MYYSRDRKQGHRHLCEGLPPAKPSDSFLWISDIGLKKYRLGSKNPPLNYWINRAGIGEKVEELGWSLYQKVRTTHPESVW